MAGKRRAARPRHFGLPGRVWVVLLVVVVAVIGFIVTHLSARDTPAPSSNPATTPSASSPGPTSSAPTSATTPSASAIPTTPARLPHFAPDQPRRLAVGDLLDVGFDDAVTATGDRLHPAGPRRVSRWRDRGSPGSPGTDTVVVIGSGAHGAAFAKLARARPGDKVTLRTDRGTLIYTIATSAVVPSTSLLRRPAITEHRPGRLVLVSERYAASGERLNGDQLVVAVLTGAAAA